MRERVEGNTDTRDQLRLVNLRMTQSKTEPRLTEISFMSFFASIALLSIFVIRC